MREVVDVLVGQCGNQIGNKFWQTICEEHGVEQTGLYNGDSDLQLENIDVYFKSMADGRHIPRAILTDVESGTIDSVKCSPNGHLFQSKNMISSHTSTDRVWFNGHYTEGVTLIGSILEAIRKEVESCDSLDTFQMTHSIGGSTGGGLGSLIIDRLKEEYPSNLVTTFSVVPSPKVSATENEPYNSILTMNHLIEHADQCFMFDNSRLDDIFLRNVNTSNTKHAGQSYNMNITAAMCGITSGMRFASNASVNKTFRTLATNLISYPRLHFFMPSIAPFADRGFQEFRTLTVPELVTSVFNTNNFLCGNPHTGRYLSAAFMIRGRQQKTHEIYAELFRAINRADFVQWIPDNYTWYVCSIPPKGIRQHITMIANHTAIQDVWRNLSAQIHSHDNSNGTIRCFISEGMEELEFLEAEENLNCLVSEYQEMENATVEVPFHSSSPDCC